MANQIHPNAMVSPKAKLGDNITVGPYAVIEDNVTIGSGTVIDSFAQVLGHTQVGSDCRIFSYAMIGSIPQDLKYSGHKSHLIVGNKNIIREFVTMNPGTEEGGKTVVGDNNLIMAYSHIAHDCIVGSSNVLANAATLAGHVTIEDNVVIGGLVAIHQFCRVGNFSILGGCSKVVQDIPPYSMCDGHPAKICGLNLIGLRRAKFASKTISDIKKAFKILFFDKHSVSKALELAKDEFPKSKEVGVLVDFVASSKRGLSK